MSRTVQEAIALACQIPADFHRRRDVSLRKLLEESGYSAHRSAISSEAICQYLREHPNLIGEWSIYSDDKRTDKGWYFDHPMRQIGYFSGSSSSQVETFDDDTEACSVFIKYELDSAAERLSEGTAK